jgi:hypothetical protein
MPARQYSTAGYDPFVGHLVGNDEMTRRVDGALHIVAVGRILRFSATRDQVAPAVDSARAVAAATAAADVLHDPI